VAGITGNIFIDRCARFFTLERNEARSTLFFLRALQAFALMKCLTLWSVADVIMTGQGTFPASVPGRFIFLPSLLVESHHHTGLALICIVLFGLFFVKPNYVTNFILFWIALNLYKLKYPVTNGSDYLLITLSIYSIPLSFYRLRNTNAETISISIFNLFRLLAAIQVAIVYLISAWDKIGSPIWRSGEAFRCISNIDTTFNPVVLPLFNSPAIALILSWITIIFEMLFVVLIWQKRTRLFILCVGVVFHLVIWFMLSLPDFALLMIISYLIVVRDEDLDNLRATLRLQPR
jgi:hypothetical protein